MVLHMYLPLGLRRNLSTIITLFAACLGFGFGERCTSESISPLPIVFQKDQLTQVKLGEEFGVQSTVENIQFSAVGTQDASGVDYQLINSLLTNRVDNEDGETILLCADSAMAVKIEDFLTNFTASQQVVQSDAYYASLVPRAPEFVEKWLKPQAYVETDSVDIPKLPELSFSFAAKCRMLQGSESGQLRCEMLRIVITPSPTPATAKECGRTLSLPSICIDKESAFKTYLSKLTLVGRSIFLKDANRALCGSEYSRYLADILTADEQIMKQVNLRRYQKIKAYVKEKYVSVPDRSEMLSFAEAVCGSKEKASRQIGYFERVTLKQLLPSLQSVFLGEDDSLTKLTSIVSKLNGLEKSIEPRLLQYLMESYFPHRVFFIVDHENISLVDGTTAIEMSLRMRDSLAIDTEPNTYRDDIKALLENLSNLKPELPEPALPPRPMPPDNPFSSNLRNRLGMSPKELDEHYLRLEEMYFRQLENSTISADQYLNKMLEFGRDRNELRELAKPSVEQMQKYQLALSKYKKAFAEWQAKVETILRPWRDHNARLQRLWDQKKVPVKGFLTGCLRNISGLDNAIRFQRGLDISGTNRSHPSVLLPSTRFLLDNLVKR